MTAFSVLIPVKPYLKKYIESLYGSPVYFDSRNYFGIVLLSLMERKFYYRKNQEIKYKAFDQFTSLLEIKLPKWWLLQGRFPTDISVQNVIFINKLFEEKFEEDLCAYCMFCCASGIEIKNAIESFCTLHKIIIDAVDEDISYDGLKKKEWRHRQNFPKKIYAHLSRENFLIKSNFEKKKIAV